MIEILLSISIALTTDDRSDTCCQASKRYLTSSGAIDVHIWLVSKKKFIVTPVFYLSSDIQFPVNSFSNACSSSSLSNAFSQSVSQPFIPTYAPTYDVSLWRLCPDGEWAKEREMKRRRKNLFVKNNNHQYKLQNWPEYASSSLSSPLLFFSPSMTQRRKEQRGKERRRPSVNDRRSLS